MAYTSSIHCAILALPQELLHEIVQLSIPDGFEGLMVTCKTIYQVGAPFIQEYKLWRKRIIFDRYNPILGYPLFYDLLGLFSRLLQLSRIQQKGILQHTDELEWSPLSYSISHEATMAEVLQRLASEAPWLWGRIKTNGTELQSLKCQSRRFGDELFKSGLEIDAQHAEPTPLDITTAHLKQGATILIPDLIGLLLFPNLKSLTINDDRIKDCGRSEFLALIDHQRGELYFQHLQILDLQDYCQRSLQEIAPLLLLPNLKSLTVHRIEDRPQLIDGKVATFESLCRDRISVLENIYFNTTGAEIPSIATFLNSCLRLRSFAWEHIGIPAYYNYVDAPSYNEQPPNRVPYAGSASSLSESLRSDLVDSENQGDDESRRSLDSEVHWTTPPVDHRSPSYESLYRANPLSEEALNIGSASIPYEFSSEDLPMSQQHLDNRAPQLQTPSIGSYSTGSMSTEYKNYGDPYDNPYHRFWRRRYWDPVVEYSSEAILEHGEPAEDSDDDRSTVDGWMNQLREGLIYWDLTELFTDVLLPCKNTLEYLKLTVALRSDWYDEARIKTSKLVDHFRDFNNMKYLEFDTRLVRPQKGKHGQIPPDGFPLSLAAILPNSIETVRVLVLDPNFHIVHAMMQNMPYRIGDFPHLRTIFLKLMADYKYATYIEKREVFETRNRIVVLQAKLQTLGVALVIEAGEHGGIF